jgi:SAM-dependent methyltransferase
MNSPHKPEAGQPTPPQPRPCLTPEQARRTYDHIGRLQDLQAVYERRPINELLAHADFEHAHAVIEFGHGTGALARRLLDHRLPSDAHYTGVDISPHMHQLATHRLQPYHDRVALQLADGTLPLPFPDGSFDRFLAVYVFDLLDPDAIAQVLANAQRLLAADGLLCLASLTAGATRSARLLTHAWQAIWTRNPALLGGCRPIQLTPYLDPAHWTTRHHTTVTALAITTEVLVAAKRPAWRVARRRGLRRGELSVWAVEDAVGGELRCVEGA